MQETGMAFGGEGQVNGISIIAVAVLGQGKAHKGRLKGDAGPIRCQSDDAIVDNVLPIVEDDWFRSRFPAGIAIVAFIWYIHRGYLQRENNLHRIRFFRPILRVAA